MILKFKMKKGRLLKQDIEQLVSDDGNWEYKIKGISGVKIG